MSAPPQPDGSGASSHTLPKDSKPSDPVQNFHDIWTAARCEQNLRDLHERIDAAIDAKECEHALSAHSAITRKKNDEEKAKGCKQYVARTDCWAEKVGFSRQLRSDVERLGGPECGAEW